MYGAKPPDAVNVWLPLGARETVAGEMDAPAVTVTVLVATLPSESVARTTSVALPVGPAMYAPVLVARVAPEAFVASDQVQPAPLPPDAVNVWLPLGASDTVAGEMDAPALTVTLAVAVFPSESAP